MISQRIDRILMGLGALLILISSYQLFFKDQYSSSGNKLGTLTSTLSIVKTKHALSLEWKDATSGNDLMEDQLIYTDNASSADVSFTDGNALEISENSLVRLRAVGNEQAMDLSKGFIRAKIESDKPLKVQMNGEDYIVSGKNADVQINLQNAQGEIGVLQGEVKVEAAGISETINTQNALEINDLGFKKKVIYFKTVSPERKAAVYSLTGTADIAFRWEPAEHGKIIVSSKMNLEKPIFAEGAGSGTMLLSEGLYYFRVESDKGTSLVSSFKVVRESAPSLIRPLNGEEVSILEGEESEVVLQWRNPQNLKYLLEWNDGELHSREVTGESAIIRVPDVKSFGWRLRISSPMRPLALWSERQVVTLVGVPKPTIPSELVPHDVEYQTYETPAEDIDLSWKSDHKVQVEVQSPDGSIATYEGLSNTLKYHADKAGTYSWRARSQDDYLRISPWSDWKKFSIEDRSGEFEGDGVQKFQLKKPDQSVTFSWEAEEGAVSVFELAKDAKFQTVVKKLEAKGDSARVSIPEIGAYYWRSRELKPDGTINVSEPRRVIIEPVPAPTKPEKLPDLEIPLQTIPKSTSILKKIFDWLIPSAHADESKGMVRLELPVKEEGKGYVVRIFRDRSLSELVFEEEIPSKEFTWKNAQTGTFYWQYAIIDFWDRKSPFSDPALLTVTAEIVAVPEKPRLLAPIRAKEISRDELTFDWTHSNNNHSYKIEISDSRSFKKILFDVTTKKSQASFPDATLAPGLYFWRIHAFNKKNAEVRSNTGRFVIKKDLEKILIVDHAPWKKVWRSRAFLAWTPSLDSYTFEDGETGKISGTALMGLSLSGTQFREKWVFHGELIRQSGQVFEGEGYLFQRIMLEALRVINEKHHHKVSIGLAAGQVSGQTYKIGDLNKVTAESVSGLSYGPVLRNFYSFNQNWEAQGKLQYLLGEIKQLEAGVDVINFRPKYLLLGGVSYSSREYEVSSGSQSSIKLSLGIGKEF